MTRWGVLSDIHGNLPALERALAGCRLRRVDRIAVLGDNLGRGESDRCVALIRRVADVSVVGNRDLDWRDRVSEETSDYVVALPPVSVVDGIVFSHGDARLTRDLATDGVRAGFRRARRWLAVHGCGVWMFGHSHHARVWTVADDAADPVLHVDASTATLPALVTLPPVLDRPGACIVVNAGSVGLPFGGKGPASALVYDAGARTVEIFAV